MTAEDITYQGRVYRRHPGHPDRHRRVYYMATTAPRTYLHRDIYASEVAPIPEGWHVHHIDHDPLNNAASNLSAMDPDAHLSHHGLNHPETAITCAHCGESFTGRRSWARWCSPACKEQDRRDRGVAYDRPRIGPYSEQRACEDCGNEYEARRPWARFCSSACKRAARRAAA